MIWKKTTTQFPITCYNIVSSKFAFELGISHKILKKDQFGEVETDYKHFLKSTFVGKTFALMFSELLSTLKSKYLIWIFFSAENFELHLHDACNEDLIKKNKKRKPLGSIFLNVLMKPMTKEQMNEVSVFDDKPHLFWITHPSR